VSANGGSDLSVSDLPFCYLPAPAIKRASPPADARGDGTRVLVAGRGFVDARATTCASLRGDRRRHTVALRDRARVRRAAAAR